jgi:hypothetical protein
MDLADDVDGANEEAYLSMSHVEAADRDTVDFARNVRRPARTKRQAPGEGYKP